MFYQRQNSHTGAHFVHLTTYLFEEGASRIKYLLYEMQCIEDFVVLIIEGVSNKEYS